MQKQSAEEDKNSRLLRYSDIPEWMKGEGLNRKISGCSKRCNSSEGRQPFKGSIRLKFKRTGTKTKRRDSSGLTRTDATIRD